MGKKHAFVLNALLTPSKNMQMTVLGVTEALLDLLAGGIIALFPCCCVVAARKSFL